MDYPEFEDENFVIEDKLIKLIAKVKDSRKTTYSLPTLNSVFWYPYLLAKSSSSRFVWPKTIGTPAFRRKLRSATVLIILRGIEPKFQVTPRNQILQTQMGARTRLPPDLRTVALRGQ